MRLTGPRSTPRSSGETPLFDTDPGAVLGCARQDERATMHRAETPAFVARERSRTRAWSVSAKSSRTAVGARAGKANSPARRGNMIGSAAATSRPRLVDTANFLLATRDSGYRSTAYAVAEFVDNSLQAGATCVAIDLLARDEKSFPMRLVSIARGGAGETRGSTRRRPRLIWVVVSALRARSGLCRGR
jgi:hypothetical protein